MICAQPDSNGFLQVVELASSESCEYYQLVEQSQITNPPSQLDATTVFALIGAATLAYSTTFIVNLVLRQLGYKG